MCGLGDENSLCDAAVTSLVANDDQETVQNPGNPEPHHSGPGPDVELLFKVSDTGKGMTHLTLLADTSVKSVDFFAQPLTCLATLEDFSILAFPNDGIMIVACPPMTLICFVVIFEPLYKYT